MNDKMGVISCARLMVLGFLFALNAVPGVLAQDRKPAVEPWKRQVFFGEQHMHTQN